MIKVSQVIEMQSSCYFIEEARVRGGKMTHNCRLYHSFVS